MNHLFELSTPPWLCRAIHKRWVLARYREIEAGRGPIYCNLVGRPERAVGFGDSVRLPDLVHGAATYFAGFRHIDLDIYL
jgi:hypothetical protein